MFKTNKESTTAWFSAKGILFKPPKTKTLLPTAKQIPNFFSGRPLEGTPYRNIYNVYKDSVWKKHFIGGNMVIDKLIIMMEKVRGRQIVRREPPV